MSNYNLQVSWSGKDALSDSDPDKIISGDDFHTEFTAVQTAVNSKADLNGDAGESFSATTAVAGTNTTQVATTAFVTTAIDNSEAWPVGSVFTAVVSTDPATLLGYGTWSAFATGRMLIGIDSGDTDFDTVEETGGSKTHTLDISELPDHSHKQSGQSGYNDGTEGNQYSPEGTGHVNDDAHAGGVVNNDSTGTAVAAGLGNAHNNMPPYIAVYMWKRTA